MYYINCKTIFRINICIKSNMLYNGISIMCYIFIKCILIKHFINNTILLKFNQDTFLILFKYLLNIILRNISIYIKYINEYVIYKCL